MDDFSRRSLNDHLNPPWIENSTGTYHGSEDFVQHRLTNPTTGLPLYGGVDSGGYPYAQGNTQMDYPDELVEGSASSFPRSLRIGLFVVFGLFFILVWLPGMVGGFLKHF